MAKKNPPNDEGRAERMREFTPDELRVIARRLTGLSDELQAIAKAMDDSKLKGVVIDGAEKPGRALPLLEKFYEYAIGAVKRAQLPK